MFVLISGPFSEKTVPSKYIMRGEFAPTANKPLNFTQESIVSAAAQTKKIENREPKAENRKHYVVCYVVFSIEVTTHKPAELLRRGRARFYRASFAYLPKAPIRAP